MTMLIWKHSFMVGICAMNATSHTFNYIVLKDGSRNLIGIKLWCLCYITINLCNTSAMCFTCLCTALILVHSQRRSTVQLKSPLQWTAWIMRHWVDLNAKWSFYSPYYLLYIIHTSCIDRTHAQPPPPSPAGHALWWQEINRQYVTAPPILLYTVPCSWSLLSRLSAVWARRLKQRRCCMYAQISRRAWYLGGSWKSSL